MTVNNTHKTEKRHLINATVFGADNSLLLTFEGLFFEIVYDFL